MYILLDSTPVGSYNIHNMESYSDRTLRKLVTNIASDDRASSNARRHMMVTSVVREPGFSDSAPAPKIGVIL